MPSSEKTDPQNQQNSRPKTPTIKDQAKGGGKGTGKVNLEDKANPSKPSQVHGHNVNRTGPGGSK